MLLKLTERVTVPGSTPRNILVNTSGMLVATPTSDGTRLSMASGAPHVDVRESLVEIDQRIEGLARNEWPD
jgi:hypothetical protein